MFPNFFNKFNKQDTVKKKILSNVFWAMLGKVINMLGNLFVGILVARYLGPEQYGLMNYVISYVTIFTVISTFGLTNIEVRELSRTPEKRDVLMGTCFSIRLFFASVGYLLVVVSLFLYKSDFFTSVMILVYSLSLFSGCFEVIRNYFTSIVKNEYVVKSEISRTVIGAFVKVVLLWYKAPLEYFICATLFDTFLVASGYCISYSTVVDKIKKWSFDRNLVPFLIKQSFPLVLSGAAVIIYQRIDQVMLGNMLDKESVGYFATASKFLDLVLFLPVVITQTVTPILVKTYNSGNKILYDTRCIQFLSIVIWVSILLSLIVSFSSYWLILLSFGKEYVAAVPVLQILSFKTIGMAISSAGGQLIIIENKQKWAVFKNILGCLTCIILNSLVIPKYGVVGSAYVTIVTILVASMVGSLFIPPYWDILKKEVYSVLFGFRYLPLVLKFFERK